MDSARTLYNQQLCDTMMRMINALQQQQWFNHDNQQTHSTWKQILQSEGLQQIIDGKQTMKQRRHTTQQNRTEQNRTCATFIEIIWLFHLTFVLC